MPPQLIETLFSGVLAVSVQLAGVLPLGFVTLVWSREKARQSAVYHSLNQYLVVCQGPWIVGQGACRPYVSALEAKGKQRTRQRGDLSNNLVDESSWRSASSKNFLRVLWGGSAPSSQGAVLLRAVHKGRVETPSEGKP